MAGGNAALAEAEDKYKDILDNLEKNTCLQDYEVKNIKKNATRNINQLRNSLGSNLGDAAIDTAIDVAGNHIPGLSAASMAHSLGFWSGNALNQLDLDNQHKRSKGMDIDSVINGLSMTQGTANIAGTWSATDTEAGFNNPSKSYAKTFLFTANSAFIGEITLNAAMSIASYVGRKLGSDYTKVFATRTEPTGINAIDNVDVVYSETATLDIELLPAPTGAAYQIDISNTSPL